MYAIFCIILYPLGIPALFAYLLTSRRAVIGDVGSGHLVRGAIAGTKPDKRVEAEAALVASKLGSDIALARRKADGSIKFISFLFSAYSPRCWYYEIVECARRLLLTGMLVFYKDGSNTQIVVALVLAFGSLMVLSETKPYIDPLDNRLAVMALWVTILTLLASLMLGAGITEDDGYNKDVLGAAMVCINVSLIVAAVGLQIYSCVLQKAAPTVALYDTPEPAVAPECAPGLATNAWAAQPQTQLVSGDAANEEHGVAAP